MVQSNLNYYYKSQTGFTLVELMIVVAIIGILASIATVSYQTRVKQSQLVSIYQELSHFKLPYQMLMDEGVGATEFSPSGLNMPAQTKYCQFSVVEPSPNASTPNAVTCKIQNLSYLLNETMSLDLMVDGKWGCTTSAGISKSYLPQACQ